MWSQTGGTLLESVKPQAPTTRHRIRRDWAEGFRNPVGRSASSPPRAALSHHVIISPLLPSAGCEAAAAA